MVMVESWLLIHWPDTAHQLRKSTFTQNPQLVTIQIKTTTSWQHNRLMTTHPSSSAWQQLPKLQTSCRNRQLLPPQDVGNKTKLHDSRLQNFLHSRIHKDPTLEKGDTSRTEIVQVSWVPQIRTSRLGELNCIAQKPRSELEIWELVDPHSTSLLIGLTSQFLCPGTTEPFDSVIWICLVEWSRRFMHSFLGFSSLSLASGAFALAFHFHFKAFH